VRALFGLTGLAFLVIAFKTALHDARGSIVPGWGSLLGTEAAILAGLVFLARGWTCLFGDRERRPLLARGLYLGQIGKYVPGGIWQAVGQVGLATRAGIAVGQASAAFVVHAITQVAAGGTVGALLVFGSSLPLRIRLLSLLGLAPIALLHRGWMRSALRLLRRRIGAAPAPEELPTQRVVLTSYAWSVVMIASLSVAFAILVSAIGDRSDFFVAVPGFALSWTIGFLAIPFPSGIGIREAVLIGTLGTVTGTTTIVAASVFKRLAMMAGEITLIALTSARRNSTAST
jgi:hypothetical protein